jgi:hypothetical protein
VIPDGLPPLQASYSTAQAVSSPPAERAYGAIGAEAEDRHRLLWLNGRHPGYGSVIATRTSGLEMVIDDHNFWRTRDRRLFGSLEEAHAAGDAQPTPEMHPIGEIRVRASVVLENEQRSLRRRDALFTSRPGLPRPGRRRP